MALTRGSIAPRAPLPFLGSDISIPVSQIQCRDLPAHPGSLRLCHLPDARAALRGSAACVTLLAPLRSLPVTQSPVSVWRMLCRYWRFQVSARGVSQRSVVLALTGFAQARRFSAEDTTPVCQVAFGTSSALPPNPCGRSAAPPRRPAVKPLPLIWYRGLALTRGPNPFKLKHLGG